ncbi:solute carrier family 25 member 44a [Paralichthys olivaceus]|uniref:solute carrier family 25 member 44a n=1 Tax=Paralichthys olivaceus TaxID=8255 RepID=UPI003750534E
MQRKGEIEIIEWEHLDKRKFFSLNVLLALTTRATVYPTNVIRTHLQVQRGKSLYSGTFDALCKIVWAEGVRGLYRGFMVYTLSIFSKQAYLTTYEVVRKCVSLHTSNNTVKSLVAGGTASLLAQTISVPIDVVSQHLMMQGQGKHLTRFKTRPEMTFKGRLTLGQTHAIVRQIFAADGLRGFYRGYVASILTYIPSSALWWTLYHFYTEQMSSLAPRECPHLVVQAVAGPLSAATTAIVTNPIDVVRSRMQVEGRSSLIKTFKHLVVEEGAWGMTKGLSARIIAAVPTSMVIVLGYETLKRLSLRDDLVESRHW